MKGICNFCGVEFVKRRKTTKSCSKKCYYESKKNGKVIKCEICENNLYLPLSRILDINFCSISCTNIHKHKNGKFGIHSSSNFEKIDWVKCQKLYDDGLSLKYLKKFGATMKFINKAILPGLFNKDDNRVYKQSDESKKKISDKLKKSHESVEHKGWYHINSRKDRTSYPERFFLKVLKNNGLFEKFNIEQKLCIGKYFLDFAIVDLKLDVEIDGQQHFRDEDSILHDKIRNQYLIDNGWKVYRICWIEMVQNPKDQINNFLRYVNNIDNESSHYYVISDIVIKKKPKYLDRLDYFSSKKEKYDLEQQKYIDLVLSSNIDFSKFGWVIKLSSIINQKPGKVNQWMMRIMPDFYNDNCFKKKSNAKSQHQVLN